MSEIRGLAESMRRLPARRRAEVSAELERLAGPDRTESGLRSADVRALADGGFEIGFHTVGHDVLPALDDRALSLAMTDGRGEVERAAGQPVSCIAYPHGEADSRVALTAAAAGFEHGFTTRAAGRSMSGDDPMLLDRIYPEFGSAERLGLELAVRAVHRRRA